MENQNRYGQGPCTIKVIFDSCSQEALLKSGNYQIVCFMVGEANRWFLWGISKMPVSDFYFYFSAAHRENIPLYLSLVNGTSNDCKPSIGDNGPLSSVLSEHEQNHTL